MVRLDQLLAEVRAGYHGAVPGDRQRGLRGVVCRPGFEGGGDGGWGRMGPYTRPGKRLNYGKIQHFEWENSTISMAIFNSYVKLPEGIVCVQCMYMMYIKDDMYT